MGRAELSYLEREVEEAGSETGWQKFAGPWEPRPSAIAHLPVEEAPSPLVTSQLTKVNSSWHSSTTSRANRSGVLSVLRTNPNGDLSSGTTKKILLCRENQPLRTRGGRKERERISTFPSLKVQ